MVPGAGTGGHRSSLHIPSLTAAPLGEDKSEMMRNSDMGEWGREVPETVQMYDHHVQVL